MSIKTSAVKTTSDVFKDHVVTKGQGNSWYLGKPGTSMNSFRVAWSPGAVTIYGDIGETMFLSHRASRSLWAAVFYINFSSYNYLMCDSLFIKEFDREMTIESILESSIEEGEEFDWSALGRHYRPDLSVEIKRNRVEIANFFRSDENVSPDLIYEIFSDPEMIVMSYKSSTRLLYDGVKLWSKMIIESEPRWHKAWRRFKRFTHRIRMWHRRQVSCKIKLLRLYKEVTGQQPQQGQSSDPDKIPF